MKIFTMQPPNVLYINKIGGKRLFTAKKWLPAKDTASVFGTIIL